VSFLPPEDRNYLISKECIFEEVEDDGQKAIILKQWLLPKEQFDTTKVDVLILLPPGYPDIAPDMFYLIPWVKLESTGCYPSKADHPLNFAGKEWQRWSRHNKEWRLGTDGIWTMIKRVQYALKEAV